MNLGAAPSLSSSAIQPSSLPRWIHLRHLPSRGVLHSDESAAVIARGVSSGDPPGPAAPHAPNAKPASAPASTLAPAPAVSDQLLRRERARSTLRPPGDVEVEAHLRWLSTAAMRAVAARADECAGRALVQCRQRCRGVHDRSGAGGSGRTTTVADEVTFFLDMFLPAADGYHDDDDDGLRSHRHGESSFGDYETDLHASPERRGKNIETVGVGERVASTLPSPISRRCDPTLLPVALVKCHPSLLDRAEMVRRLVDDLRNDRRGQSGGRRRFRTCVCVLRRGATESAAKGAVGRRKRRRWQCRDLVADVLSQCLAQDDVTRGECDGDHRRKKRKRDRERRLLFRHVSPADALVEWAGETERFDSITVVVVDPERIPPPTLGAFVSVLASLRSTRGVPVSLVATEVDPGGGEGGGGGGDRWSRLRQPSLMGGAGGAVIAEVRLPPPEVILENFLHSFSYGSDDRDGGGACVPECALADDRILDSIRERFHEEDSSVVSAARELKRALRLFFAKPGSFLSLLHCEEFVVPNWPRLAWLMVEERARSYLAEFVSDNSSLPSLSSRYGHGIVLARDLEIWVNSSVWHHRSLRALRRLLPENMSVNESSTDQKSTSLASATGGASKPLARDLKSHTRDVLCVLSVWKQQLSRQARPGRLPNDLSIRLSRGIIGNKLNESIVLIAARAAAGGGAGNCPTVPFSNGGVAVALPKGKPLEWIHRAFPFALRERARRSPTAHPRRDVAKVLCSYPDALDFGSVEERSLAFGVFQSRVMTISEWYRTYSELVRDEDGLSISNSNVKHERSQRKWKRFSLAVYELRHCGFVQQLSRNKKEDTFEKVAIVWGSGK